MNNVLDTIESILSNETYASQIKHHTITVPINTKIISVDEKFHDLYIIKEGKMRVRLSSDTEQKVHPHVATLRKGDLFGEFALFEDTPACADVISIEESELIQIDIKSFCKFLETNPEIGYRFLHSLFRNFSNRIRSTNKSLFKILEWGLKAHEIDKYL